MNTTTNAEVSARVWIAMLSFLLGIAVTSAHTMLSEMRALRSELREPSSRETGNAIARANYRLRADAYCRSIDDRTIRTVLAQHIDVCAPSEELTHELMGALMFDLDTIKAFQCACGIDPTGALLTRTQRCLQSFVAVETNEL